MVTIDRRTDDTVMSARLITGITACQHDGGYVCVFDDGDPSNTTRNAPMDCPECKYSLISGVDPVNLEKGASIKSRLGKAPCDSACC